MLAAPALIVVLVATVALPIVSLGLVVARRWLALVPLVGSLGIFAAWFLYYVTDWWTNPGQGVWLPAFLLVLVGWVCAGVAARGARR